MVVLRCVYAVGGSRKGHCSSLSPSLSPSSLSFAAAAAASPGLVLVSDGSTDDDALTSERRSAVTTTLYVTAFHLYLKDLDTRHFSSIFPHLDFS